MWTDRLTGGVLKELPEPIKPGRYIENRTASLLVGNGSKSCLVEARRYPVELPHKSLEQKAALFERILETLDTDSDVSDDLPSPLMPEEIVNDDSDLNSFEEELISVIKAGHLQQISKRPRLDLRYEDEVTDVARAKRMAKGALVHLASHSECWQRQTLSGVVPKRIKARFSEDDYNTYENLVYARLLDKVEQYLNWRIATLRQLTSVISEALGFYGETTLSHRLTKEICRLWGQTFNEDATNKATEQLKETLKRLESCLGVIQGLKQNGLYLHVNRYAQVEGGIHLTNILSHDQHYRHLPILWKELRSVAGGKQASPEERETRNGRLHKAYSRYAGLVLRHALLPYINSGYSADWAGKHLELRQEGLDWKLLLRSPGDKGERVLLQVVPWLGFVPRPEEISQQQPGDSPLYIAWPNLDEDFSDSAEQPTNDCWIPLSPFDLYAVERFGRVIDQLLQYELAKQYGQPLSKIPNKPLQVAESIKAVSADQERHEMRVLEALQAEDLSKLEKALLDENAEEQARQLSQQNNNIVQLQVCPVCSALTQLVHQSPNSFRIRCRLCRTDRYLIEQSRGKKLQQKLEGSSEFKIVGRRGFEVDV
ncbi:hypothetical protein [Marinospirillum insulare]|uniref:DUF2357 domain-containing protein n=1 Tax=Marinospirillum insulare TaxID=217169 RepID=A0ABQ5ZTP3_9GAMM|nr:hypothetical protein [Marinospirillum insulare]GLR62807.1 hypothetical protein GCM10007878_02420 [Marinospirillum insulare]